MPSKTTKTTSKQDQKSSDVSKYWTFTCYKTHEPISMELDNRIEFLIYQTEICPSTQKEHYQGFVAFNQSMRLSGFIKIFGKHHAEKSLGSFLQNVYYCSKSSSFKEDGIRYCSSEEYIFKEDPTFHWGRFADTKEIQRYLSTYKKPRKGKQGARSDIRELDLLIAKYSSYHECLQFADVDQKLALIKYKNYVYDMYLIKPKAKAEWPHPTFLPWQQQLLEFIEQPPDRRSIIFICDTKGRSGKSDMTTYLFHNKNAFRCSGPCSGIYYEYKLETLILCDAPRSENGDTIINYSALESLKNGIVTSSKYQSITKYRPPNQQAHIIVFTNSYPDIHNRALSKDRYVIYDITDIGLLNVTKKVFTLTLDEINYLNKAELKVSDYKRTEDDRIDQRIDPTFEIITDYY